MAAAAAATAAAAAACRTRRRGGGLRGADQFLRVADQFLRVELLRVADQFLSTCSTSADTDPLRTLRSSPRTRDRSRRAPASRPLRTRFAPRDAALASPYPR